MHHYIISSSNIGTIGYDPLSERLRVSFTAKPNEAGSRDIQAVWEYRSVEPKTVDLILFSDQTPGQAFASFKKHLDGVKLEGTALAHTLDEIEQTLRASQQSGQVVLDRARVK